MNLHLNNGDLGRITDYGNKVKGLSQISQLTMEEYANIGTKIGLSEKALIEWVEKRCFI